MKIARVRIPLSTLLLVLALVAPGCALPKDGSVQIGLRATGPKGDIFTTQPAAGKIEQPPARFIFCAGPPFNTNKQIGLTVKLEDSRLHAVLLGAGFIWVEGEYGKAETENVIAYAEHTRFVMQVDGNTMRVFHYKHTGNQVVRVYIKRSDEKYLTETSYVELTRTSPQDTWTFVGDPTPFNEDFGNLPAPLRDFLNAVEAARAAAGLPDTYP